MPKQNVAKVAKIFGSNTFGSKASITMIGGGQMARAMAGGMIAADDSLPGRLRVVDLDPACGDWWSAHHPGVTFDDQIASADVIIVAVKPHVVAGVLQASRDKIADSLIVSIAAGVTLAQISTAAGHDRVVRVMPNTPALVGMGASGFAIGGGCNPSDAPFVQSMLESFGVAVRVPESKLDAVTGLSGSGPAYVFMLIEALADGGVAAGLDRTSSMTLAAQTVAGAAAMVLKTGEHPGVLKDRVCSPGGTTIAAVASLEQNGFRAAAISAVAAAAARSAELSVG